MRELSRSWSFLLNARRGHVGEQECLTRAGELEQELTDLATSSPLRDEPDDVHLEARLLDAYRCRWAA